jgi:hypothetical protein
MEPGQEVGIGCRQPCVTRAVTSEHQWAEAALRDWLGLLLCSLGVVTVPSSPLLGRLNEKRKMLRVSDGHGSQPLLPLTLQSLLGFRLQDLSQVAVAL